MKKRLLAVLMAAAMAATLLAGCGGDTSTPAASTPGSSTPGSSAPDASDAGEYADYPERAIEAIIAFDPGGGSDIAAR